MTVQSNRASGEPDADIIILGAGYGGLHVAQRLTSLLSDAKSDVRGPSIRLIDRRSEHQITTELPRLISGRRADHELDIDFGRLLNRGSVHFLQATVTGIRPDDRRVETTSGPVAYRYLVVALGSDSHDYGIPGVRAHMRPFRTTDDARALRIAAVEALEAAARIERTERDPDMATLRKLMTVLIGGAGPTGVEVAGELAELLDDHWEAARRVAGQPADYRLPKPHIVLVEAGATILPGWSESTIEAARQALSELRVDIRVNAAITRVEPETVYLKDGTIIEAATLLWTGGVRAPRLLAEAGLPTGPAGRVRVDPFGRVPDHPEIYVVGDSALHFDPKTGRPLPPTADLALRQAETAAFAIREVLRGREPSRVLKPLVRHAVSVGGERGAANLLGVPVRGRAAHALKDLIEWEYRQSITRFHGYGLATVV